MLSGSTHHHCCVGSDPGLHVSPQLLQQRRHILPRSCLTCAWRRRAAQKHRRSHTFWLHPCRYVRGRQCTTQCTGLEVMLHDEARSERPHKFMVARHCSDEKLIHELWPWPSSRWGARDARRGDCW